VTVCGVTEHSKDLKQWLYARMVRWKSGRAKTWSGGTL